jgi:hypothetical protein
MRPRSDGGGPAATGLLSPGQLAIATDALDEVSALGSQGRDDAPLFDAPSGP